MNNNEQRALSINKRLRNRKGERGSEYENEQRAVKRYNRKNCHLQGCG
jgi:hypothetical protein